MRKVIIVVSMVLIGIVLLFITIQKKDINNMIASTQEIILPEIQKKLYWNVRIWGISGNHSEIVLSSGLIDAKNWEYDKSRHYVFYTSEIYYKVVNSNTIVVYAPTSSIGQVPVNHNLDSIIVNIIELKSYDEVEKYSRNFKNYGLLKVSAF